MYNVGDTVYIIGVEDGPKIYKVIIIARYKFLKEIVYDTDYNPYKKHRHVKYLRSKELFKTPEDLIKSLKLSII